MRVLRQKSIFLFLNQNILWVLKRTVWMWWLFWTPKTNVKKHMLWVLIRIVWIGSFEHPKQCQKWWIRKYSPFYTFTFAHWVNTLLTNLVVTLCLLVSSADNLCKQFGTRSRPTEPLVWPGTKCLTLWWYSWKNFSKKLILKKNQQTTKKHAKLPSRQSLLIF